MQYDRGHGENARQVFGHQQWTYPFPFYTPSGVPYGNGIEWKSRNDPDEEEEADQET